MIEKKITLCMIVKNEEKMLEDCLISVKDIVDQIVIVDTGSTDNTINIAKKFQAEIYHFQWTGNFSEARNESIKYAKGDWILWLDADERLNPDSIEKLLNIINIKPNQPEIYKINIKNFQKGGDYYYLSDAHRLFSNFQGIAFSGKIHEQVSPGLKQLNGKEFLTDIEILHHGYNLNEVDQDKKNLRNQKLLEEMVKEEANYAYGYYTLAQNYAMTNKYDKAIINFQKALDLKQLNKNLTTSLLVTYAEVLMKLNKYKDAKKYIHNSIKLEKDQTGAYYLLYKMSDMKNDFISSEKWLKVLLEKNRLLIKTGKRNSTDVIINEEKILQSLGNLYGKNRKIEKYASTCHEILKINNENIFANRALLNYHIDKKEFEPAFSYLIKCSNTFTINEQEYLNVISTIFLKNQQYEKSIYVYDLMLNINPKNEFALKKIVGLLAKIGRREEAAKILLLYQNK